MQIWDMVKAAVYSSATGLSLPQFAASLRLVAAAQHGLDLWSPALVSSVLYPPTSQQRFGTLPAPRLGVEEPTATPSPSPKPPRYARCHWRGKHNSCGWPLYRGGLQATPAPNLGPCRGA